MKLVFSISLVAVLLGCAATPEAGSDPDSSPHAKGATTMDLGAFSISLSVKDPAASRSFYEKLGFRQAGGEPSQNWLILRNGTTTIGLFQGMFEGNILTFNPGWASDASELADYTDVRELQRVLEERGVELTTRAEPSTTGPASITMLDPDGNAILIDQHR